MYKNNICLLKWGILLLLCLFTMQTFAQETREPWTLERCVQFAVENNISIKQQALNVNYYENQKKQAKLDILPNANSQISYDFSFGRSLNWENQYVDQNSQSTSIYLGSNVTIFNAFAKQNTVKMRGLELQAALQDLQKGRDDIALNVASAYLNVLFNKELVAIAQQQVNITRQQIEYNKKQVDAGALAKGKLLETEAQAASEELNLTNYENQLKLSVLALQQFMELPVNDNFDIVVPNINADSLTNDLIIADSVYFKAVLQRPEILSKEFSLAAMEKQICISKAQLYPSLALGATLYDQYINTYTQSFTQQIKNPRIGIGLTLNIPIFNGYSAQTNVKNSQIQYKSAINQLQQEKNNLLKEIQTVHANALAAMKKYYSSQKALTSATEAFRYIEEKFALGIVTPLEYNQAKNSVTNAQSNFLQAKYEYLFRTKILDFYNGKPIHL